MNNSCKICELRGMWVATVYGIDWPKEKNNIQAQKKQFIEILDNLKNLNFNAVFVQIRPSSDALYKIIHKSMVRVSYRHAGAKSRV